MAAGRDVLLAMREFLTPSLLAGFTGYADGHCRRVAHDGSTRYRRYQGRAMA